MQDHSIDYITFHTGGKWKCIEHYNKYIKDKERKTNKRWNKNIDSSQSFKQNLLDQPVRVICSAWSHNFPWCGNEFQSSKHLECHSSAENSSTGTAAER